MKKYPFTLLFLLCIVDFYTAYAGVVSMPSKEVVVTDMTSCNQKINLNTADVTTLTGSFKRIGKKRAEAIVRYREEHGYFTSISQLSQVRGLGLSFVARHLPQLQATFSVG